MGRKEYLEGNNGLMIQCIPYHMSNMVKAVLWHRHANESGSWVFIDDVAAVIEMYRAFISAQI